MATFREAMDLLCIPAADVAQMFGLSTQTVRQMRLEPGNANYRAAPDGWRVAFAKLARERGGELDRLARDLDGG